VACTRHAAMQHTAELAAVLKLAADLQPQVVVEIGCMTGGALYAWRQICDEVYGITLPMGPPGYLVDHGAYVWFGDSHDPVSKEWLDACLCGRPVDVLHIDGDHSYQGVKADYEMYSPLVRPGGLVIVNDVLNDWDAPDEGRFWKELTAAREHPVIDAGLHRPLGFGVIQMEGTAA
jgi:cephalosporin hydroxylase